MKRSHAQLLEPIAIVLAGIHADLDHKTPEELSALLEACDAASERDWCWSVQAACFLRPILHARGVSLPDSKGTRLSQLRADLATVNRFIAETPESDVIDRSSWQSRRDVIINDIEQIESQP